MEKKIKIPETKQKCPNCESIDWGYTNEEETTAKCFKCGLEFDIKAMKEMEVIEKNQLFWMTKLKIDKGLNKEQRYVFKVLNEKYKAFGFWCFNYHSGFFKGLPEYEEMENQLKENPFMSVVGKENNCIYRTKEGEEIKGDVNPQLFNLKKGEVLHVEEIF